MWQRSGSRTIRKRWPADGRFDVADRVRGPRAVRREVVPRRRARAVRGAAGELDGRDARLLRGRVSSPRRGDGVPRPHSPRRAPRRRAQPAPSALLPVERVGPRGDVAPAQRPGRRRHLPRPRRGADAVSERASGSAYGFAKPAEGSWTEHYPELGTAPISYEDSISPEFYELEREAIFKR